MSGRQALRTLLGVAVGASAPEGGDAGGQLVVALTGAQRRLEVEPGGSEEAGEKLAVGGEPRPRAVAAERAAHRGDDAQLPSAVAVAEAQRHVVGVAARRRLERQLGADAADDLLRG